jgi:hypothetical protein
MLSGCGDMLGCGDILGCGDGGGKFMGELWGPGEGRGGVRALLRGGGVAVVAAAVAVAGKER